MVKVIMSSASPDLYVKGVGKICLSDMRLYNSRFEIDLVNILYSGEKPSPPFESVDLADGDLEKIVSLTKKRLKIENDFKETRKEITETTRKLQEEYGIRIPKLIKPIDDNPRIIWR